MRDSLCCFVHYSTIEQYLHVNSTLVSSAVFIHVPIPSILKFDQSIQALLYFSSILDSRKNPSSMDLHLLDSILSGRQAGISVTFKRSCSQTHQNESLFSWIKLFIDKDGDSIMRSLFWYSEKFQPTGSMSRIRGRNDVDPFLLHRKWRQWSDFDWNFHSNHSIQLDMEKVLTSPILLCFISGYFDTQRHCAQQNTDVVAPIFLFQQACSIIYSALSIQQIQISCHLPMSMPLEMCLNRIFLRLSSLELYPS